MNELKGKKEWTWNKEYDKAFRELKEKITSQPVFSLPKREGKFRVEMNAPEHTIEGVLFQEQDGKMETNSIFIKDDATCRKKLWNLWQRTTSNSGSFG